MVVEELLKVGLEILGDREYTNAQLETRVILAKLLNVDKSYIYAHEDLVIEKDMETEFIDIMQKRAKGYPIQYILKEREFMGLNFYIEEGVLIPRSDTEILVEFIIDYINENYKGRNIKILELGVGSGAIGLSIAHYCKNANVYATDISPKAIKVSNMNKERFRLNHVEILKGDLFEPIEEMKNTFDIIVSNPPYIETKEINYLQREVKGYEPMLALDGGDDGLRFYKRISREAKKFLRDEGLLIYEIGYNQGESISKILYKESYRDIKIMKDLQGLDRVILGNRGV